MPSTMPTDGPTARLRDFSAKSRGWSEKCPKLQIRQCVCALASQPQGLKIQPPNVKPTQRKQIIHGVADANQHNQPTKASLKIRIHAPSEQMNGVKHYALQNQSNNVRKTGSKMNQKYLKMKKKQGGKQYRKQHLTQGKTNYQ